VEVWVIDKKGTYEKGNSKRRLVIAFRKLNLKTVDDKYIIPKVASSFNRLIWGRLGFLQP